jgi:hypothetical protein
VAAHVAIQVPKAELHARIAGGAATAKTVPKVAPAPYNFKIFHE